MEASMEESCVGSGEEEQNKSEEDPSLEEKCVGSSKEEQRKTEEDLSIDESDILSTDFNISEISDADYLYDEFSKGQCDLNAVKEINLELMKTVVQHSAESLETRLQGVDVAYKKLAMEYPQSVLLAAIDLNDVEIVNVLLRFGVDPNVERHTDGRAIHLAALKGNVELLQLLGGAGAKVNCLGGMHKRHPLHVAVYWKRVNCVKYLIQEKRCNANIKTGITESTALHIAARNGDLGLVKYLLFHAAALVVDSHNYAPWMYALDGDHMHIVELLLSAHGVSTICEYTRKSAMHFACRVHNHRYVRYLISKGADCNVADDNGITPLIEAITYKNLGVVWYLLEQCPNIDVNAFTVEGKNSFNYAIELRLLWEEKEKYLNVLKSKGADYNQYVTPGLPLLMRYIGDMDVTRWLLCAGADMDMKCEDGATALHRAVAADPESWSPDKPSTLHLLLEHNIDLNMSSIPGPQGFTPLQEAILSGNRHLLIFLVHVGCSLNTIGTFLTSSDKVEQMRTSSPIFDDVCQWLLEACKQPRSLAFLCRKPVLTLLGHHNVRDKIRALPIPSELKRFLVYNTKFSTL